GGIARAAEEAERRQIGPVYRVEHVDIVESIEGDEMAQLAPADAAGHHVDVPFVIRRESGVGITAGGRLPGPGRPAAGGGRGRGGCAPPAGTGNRRTWGHASSSRRSFCSLRGPTVSRGWAPGVSSRRTEVKRYPSMTRTRPSTATSATPVAASVSTNAATRR